MSVLKGLVAGILLIAAPFMASAQVNPTVVELYTSQGCSSCPAADKVLGTLTTQDNVIPLAFHVTYWDRLGWKDTFAQEAYTKRQYAYSSAFGNRSVWTPQFIVQGQHYSRDSFGKMVREYIEKESGKPAEVTLQLAASGDRLQIQVADAGGQASDQVGDAQIMIAHFHDKNEVSVKRGENAGRTLTYHNVVHTFYAAGKWDGNGADSFEITLKSKPPYVVMVQSDGLGPILAAQLVR